MGKSSELKQIRGQIRQVVKEILPELLNEALIEQLQKALSNQLQERLNQIDQRQQELQSYMVRHYSVPVAPKESNNG